MILLRVPGGPAGRRPRSPSRATPTSRSWASAASTRSTQRTGAGSTTPSRPGREGRHRARSWIDESREAGRQKLIATVQNLTGVTIDHYAEINLVGFYELTKAVGGVDVCLNAAVRTSCPASTSPPAGSVSEGRNALAFVRQRHGLVMGDLDRIVRQQVFAAGLAQRLQDGGALSDATRLNQLVRIVSRYVVLDRDWDLDQAINQLRRFTGEDLVFRTIPTGRVDLQTPVDGIAVEIDQDAVRTFVGVGTGPVRAGRPAGRAPSASIAPAASPRPGAAPTGTAAPTASGAPTGQSYSSRVITADGIPCVD